MIESVLYAVLAILGLGFLVFIHELGHYWVARRQGMRVEAFAIGFGKPLFTWEHDGVKWHIGCLPFGGYVKIAGMQKERGVEPSDIPDGFYGKGPWQRIKVAFAGPLVNIIFAFVVFFGLWIFGGRDKNFAEFTHRIGWIDPSSALYEKGVRPGDVIQKYDRRKFNGFKDLMIAAIMGGKTAQIQGYKLDYIDGVRTEFDYILNTYDDPRSVKDKLNTIGILSPAQYLIYDQKEPSPSASAAGMEPKDRLVWVDGEVVFSVKQLSSLVNDSTAFLTVRRGETVFQTKVPRVRVDDLKMSHIEKAEIGDWQYEAGLKGRLPELFYIPYNLSPTCQVESRIAFIDEHDQKRAFEGCERCAHFYPLEEGDQILAIDGMSIENSYELLDKLQTRRVLVIVDRSPTSLTKPLSTNADIQFESFSGRDLHAIVSSIGTSKKIEQQGDLYLLNPMVPQSLVEMPLSSQQKVHLAQEMAAAKKQIEAIKDPQKRSEMLEELDKNQKKQVLGIPLKDLQVRYNPSPFSQFISVFEDTWRTLSGLFSGSLNPKYVSGPVGIVQVVHQSWAVGIKEAIFWMAVISLNLGIVNLLPVPVLDGGHIMFAFFEMVTKKKLCAKTMERLVIPFVGLLIGLFIYITYQDLVRLFSRFL